MNIKASDGKSYDVAPTADDSTYNVLLAGEVVASFVIDEEHTRVTLRGDKTTKRVVVEVADEFIDQGGGPMRML